MLGGGSERVSAPRCCSPPTAAAPSAERRLNQTSTPIIATRGRAAA
jgi:hypothetical protein